MGDHKRVANTITYIKDNCYVFGASSCSFHTYQHCLIVHSNVDDTSYHALCDYNSTIYVPFYEAGTLCNVPLFHRYMKQLHELMGEELILPPATFVRDNKGVTSMLYRLRKNLFPPSLRLEPENILDVFVGHALSVCCASFVMHGAVPDIKDMLFVYAADHPVLADLDRTTCAEIVNAKNTAFSDKKITKKTVLLDSDTDHERWKKFMKRTRTLIPVLRYTMVVFPTFFATHRRKRTNLCVFDAKYEFSDSTHDLLCNRSKKMSMSGFLQAINSNAEIHHVYKPLIGTLLNKLE